MASLQTKSEPASLFNQPAVSKSDPLTSHMAARKIEKSGQRATRAVQAARIVHNHPGHTAMELAEMLKVDRYWLGKALPEARELLYVTSEHSRECTVTKNPAMIWQPGATPPAK